MAHQKQPINEVQFAWKTGFITKEIWKKYFYNNKSRRSTFHAWKNLSMRKYFEPHSNRYLNDVLTLNRKNKYVLRMVDGSPAYAPSASQLEHDEVLLKGILELKAHEQIAHWQTEAELKMLKPNDFRVETSGQKIKYPDAIFYLKSASKPKIVAIEYERTQKNRVRYGQMLSAYSTLRRVDAVIWIVKSLAIQSVIIEQAKLAYYPFKERPIAFVSEQTWQSNPEKLVKLAHEILAKNSGA